MYGTDVLVPCFSDLSLVKDPSVSRLLRYISLFYIVSLVLITWYLPIFRRFVLLNQKINGQFYTGFRRGPVVDCCTWMRSCHQMSFKIPSRGPIIFNTSSSTSPSQTTLSYQFLSLLEFLWYKSGGFLPFFTAGFELSFSESAKSVFLSRFQKWVAFISSYAVFVLTVLGL